MGISGLLLIDFDNFFKRPVSEYSENEIEFEIRNLVDTMSKEDSGLEEIHVRLYGGWMFGGNLTAKASIVQQKLALVALFPFRSSNLSRRINGSIELASSIVGLPSISWHSTFVERKGVKQIRIEKIAQGQACVNNVEVCPANILHKYTKNKTRVCSVNNCNTIQQDLFVGYYQKMVDTMMACDIISTCLDPEYSSLFLVSDDVDAFPSIALGATLATDPKKILVGVRNPRNQQSWSDYFVNLGSVKLTSVL
jgi:uncharacterized LabA/DUF88 family protein